MTPFEKLADFLNQSAGSVNPDVSLLAQQLLGEDEQVEESDPSDTEQGKEDNQNIEGKILESGAFPDIEEIDAREKANDNPQLSQEEHGQKEASAFIKDVRYDELPEDVQKEVDRFVKCEPDTLLVHYGMVVSELLPKVDRHNFDQSEKSIGKEEVDKDKAYEKAKTKYVLLMNDKVVDGHHAISTWKKAGVTSSVNVLDLTPARFQRKEAAEVADPPQSMWDVLCRR